MFICNRKRRLEEKTIMEINFTEIVKKFLKYTKREMRTRLKFLQWSLL